MVIHRFSKVHALTVCALVGVLAIAEATSKLFEQKIYASNPSFGDLLFEQIKSGQMGENHFLEGDLAYKLIILLLPAFRLCLWRALADTAFHCHRLALSLCYSRCSRDHSLCAAGAGMNLTFDDKHNGRVPYELINYQLDNTPKIIASFDMQQKYHSLRANTRRGTSTSNSMDTPTSRRTSSAPTPTSGTSAPTAAPSVAIEDREFTQAFWSLLSHECDGAECEDSVGLTFIGADPSVTTELIPSQPQKILCDPGNKNMNEYRCQECGLGTYTPDPGLFNCINCPIGFYADEYGTHECKACPPGSTTWQKGRTSITECVCETGYYDPPTKITDEWEWNKPAFTYVGCFQDCGNATSGIIPCPAVNSSRRSGAEVELVRTTPLPVRN